VPLNCGCWLRSMLWTLNLLSGHSAQ
jgi:hypothetical protein